MKFLTKFGLAAAGISAAVGVAAITAGICMGGDLRNLEGKIPEISTTFVSKELLDVSRSSLEEQTEFRISSHGIERLKIEAQRAKITICEAEGDDIYYRSNRNRDISVIEGRTWIIEDRELGEENLELILFLPSDSFGEIAIEVSACEMNAECLSAENISLEFEEAAVYLQEVSVSQLAKLKIDAGSLEVGCFRCFQGARLEAECDMGSMNIICEGEYEDYNYRLKCDMGEIRLQDTSYSGLDQSVILENDGDKMIEAECDMGEIVIDFE